MRRTVSKRLYTFEHPSSHPIALTSLPLSAGTGLASRSIRERHCLLRLAGWKDHPGERPRRDRVRIPRRSSSKSVGAVGERVKVRILNDLSRSYVVLACACLRTRATTTNIMTNTDAIASLFAAFTKDELTRMAHDACVGPPEISRAPFFRLNAVKREQGGGRAARLRQPG